MTLNAGPMARRERDMGMRPHSMDAWVFTARERGRVGYL